MWWCGKAVRTPVGNSARRPQASKRRRVVHRLSIGKAGYPPAYPPVFPRVIPRVPMRRLTLSGRYPLSVHRMSPGSGPLTTGHPPICPQALSPSCVQSLWISLCESGHNVASPAVTWPLSLRSFGGRWLRRRLDRPVEALRGLRLRLASSGFCGRAHRLRHRVRVDVSLSRAPRMTVGSVARLRLRGQMGCPCARVVTGRWLGPQTSSDGPVRDTRLPHCRDGVIPGGFPRFGSRFNPPDRHHVPMRDDVPFEGSALVQVRVLRWLSSHHSTVVAIFPE